MAKRIEQSELQRWAQIGAKARLTEIEQEIANLLRVFPGLRQGRAAATRAAEQPESKPRRRRRRMSAEGRKKISDMMKKRWAERKKAKK